VAASKPDRFAPPATDELEVSVFGPGRGESIVVHVPGGAWFVVDSCNVRVGTDVVPVAVAYLRDGLGVTRLDSAFITHWHDDHTQGAGQLLQTFAESLRLVGLPGGFNQRELASFVKDLFPCQSTSRMVRGLLDVLTVLRTPAFDHTFIRMLSDGQDLAPTGVSWSLRALSPSLEDLRRQAASLMAWAPGAAGPALRSVDVNSACAVLLLDVEGFRVLFASDLDEGDSNRCGWRCIVQHYGSGIQSRILKIGHHGSSTAFCPAAIDAICGGGDTRGVLTPFPARGAPLPRESDIRRYRPRLQSLHQTASAKCRARAGAVALKYTPFSAYLSNAPVPLQSIGQVRYRWVPGSLGPTVQTFPPARAL